MGDKFLGNINEFFSTNFSRDLECKIKRKKKLQSEISSIPQSAIDSLEAQLKICEKPFEYIPEQYYKIWEQIALKIINWCCGSLGLNIGMCL